MDTHHLQPISTKPADHQHALAQEAGRGCILAGLGGQLTVLDHSLT